MASDFGSEIRFIETEGKDFGRIVQAPWSVRYFGDICSAGLSVTSLDGDRGRGGDG